MSTDAAPPPPRLVGAYGLYYLDGRPALLRAGGGAPYWRLDPRGWAGAVAAQRAAGCNALSVVVPGGEHARGPGRYDLTGESDPRLDLPRFLRLVDAAGLVALLRPTLEGNDLAAVGDWLGALGAAVASFAGHPVVAWRLDDSPAAGSAPDTLEPYRRFLVGRYESPRLLSREWRREVPDIGAVRLPGTGAAPGEVADWQAFLEAWRAERRERVGALASAAGAGVPLVWADPARPASPAAGPASVPVGSFFGLSVAPGPGTGPATRGPFDASLAALRAEALSLDERPVSVWGLEGVRDVVAAVAHGAKGFTLAPTLDAAGGDGALARLLRWLGEAEEEVTASVEVRDAIAYLDYSLYARTTPDDHRPPAGAPADERFGLLFLLLTAGYNPSVLDLAAVTEADLTEFSAAVFPSRGYLRLDDYGKLVVFTLRGGALLTFPEPATREVDGTPLNTRFLWPHPARRPPLAGALRRLIRPGVRDAAGGGTLPLSWDRPVALFPGAGEPFVRYGRRGPGPGGESGVPRAATESVRALVLLTAGGVPAGYRVQVRSGTSAVAGAPPGVAYGTPRYASLRPGARLALRRFAVRLFADVAPRQIVPDDGLEVEAVARLSPDGGVLLFVLNRLGRQRGRLGFPAPDALNLGTEVAAAVLYSAAGSAARGGAGGVDLELAPGDALVLRLT